jgi:hypothetical protein
MMNRFQICLQFQLAPLHMGTMCGWGTLKWAASGDRYDGEWEDNVEHGNGVYTWSDGSTFSGSWRRGVKHGPGLWVSAPLRPSSYALQP